MRIILMACMWCLVIGGTANAQQSFVEGREYTVIRNAAPAQNTVTEYFGYMCPQCYQAQRSFHALEQSLPRNAKYERVPVVFPGRPDVLAKAYFTAQALGDNGRIHDAIFNEINAKHKRLDNDRAVSQLFSQLGIAGEEFYKIFHSFGVENSVARATQKSRSIRSTPSLVVNGKYLISGRQLTQNLPGLVQFLLAR